MSSTFGRGLAALFTLASPCRRSRRLRFPRRARARASTRSRRPACCASACSPTRRGWSRTRSRPGRSVERPGVAARQGVREAPRREARAGAREPRDEGAGARVEPGRHLGHAARRDARPAEGRRLRHLLDHQRLHVRARVQSEVRRREVGRRPQQARHHDRVLHGRRRGRLGQGALPEGAAARRRRARASRRSRK